MSIDFQSFVEKVANQIDGNHEEKADICEELMSHLNLSKEEYIAAGYADKEAGKKAMSAFGDASEVGEQIQQAKFPYRKAMLLTLAIASILFSFTVYLMALFTYGDAHFAWLISSVIISSTLLLFALQILPSLDRKLWLNITLIFYVFFYLYGTLLTVEPITSITGWILIALAITLIYLTAMYVYNPENQELMKQLKRLHLLNISVGIIIIAATLFFIWSILAFGDDESFRVFFVTLTPLFVWLIAYIAQITLLTKGKKKVAFTITLISVLLGSVILLLLILLFRP